MAGTVNFVDVDGTTASKAVDGSTVANWVSSASVATNADNFLTGTTSVSDKVSNTTATGYGQTTGIVGEPWNFTSGGGDEGNHIFGIINSAGTRDTLANGGYGLIAAESGGTDSFGTWYVGPQAGSIGGWEYFVINPAADFDAVTAGTHVWTLAGNPAQLDNVDGLGVRWKITNTVMGASDNAFLQTISVGVGYNMTGTAAVFSEFVTYEETNRFGALLNLGGVLFPLCQLRIGTFSGAGNVTFDDDGFNVVWLGQTLSDGTSDASAVGFYGFFAQQGTGTTDITLANGSLAATSPAEFDLALSGVNSVNITNLAVDRARVVTLDSAVDWDIGQIKNSGQIDASGAIFTNVDVQSSTVAADVGAVLWQSTTNPNTKLDGTGVTKTTGVAHHAFEFGDTTPTTITLTDNFFSGFNASNAQNDSTLYFNTTGAQAYTVNLSGNTGDATVSYKVNPAGTATVTIVSAVTVTFTGMKDNTEVRIYTAGTFTELDGIENATAGSPDDRSFTASVASGTSVDYILFSTLYVPIHVLSFSWPTVSGGSIPVTQILDLNYSNP